ncbi:MAG TPA: molybdopterin-dependent oxidoreductase [Candidatus Binatia bacterium]|nr:molybdopterin-dependent oxidoreductase [Candidatus Binatia bacterium]
MATTVLRSCNLCEAGCGLKFEVEGSEILSVAPDHDDPQSRGYVCPKGLAIADVHRDPDRLRRPVRRAADGSFHEISWDEAFELAGARLREIRSRHGADAIAAYFGNPLVHNYSGIIMAGSLLNALGTKNRTSAGSQDTSPRFAASHHLYGSTLVAPVPDLDHTDYFLCIGANPAVSQGSAMVTPDVKSRLRDVRARGGKVVVVDPRASETAKLADEHVFIRPGGDAAFVLSLLQALVASGEADVNALRDSATGWEDVEPRLAPFSPEATAGLTRVDPETTRRIARELAVAARSVVYTRVGTCNNAWGTLATWANDVLNLALGSLGAPGGAMFPEPALDGSQFVRLGGMNGHARWRSRVRGLPETGCDLPASILAEEMETPGDGQVRALVTIAGNPVLSTPNGRRLERALGQLEFMVSVDLYVNETTRHADVILPPSWSLAEDHSEPLTPSFSLRNHVRWCAPVVPRAEGELADWQILLRLSEQLGGGPFGRKWLDRGARVARALGWRYDPERALDLLLRIGPHGDRFLPWRDGLRLAKVKASPYGVDLGPARPGFRHRVQHADGKVHLAAGPFFEAMEALGAEVERARGRSANGELLLIGRRELRSNNSWMHNVPALVAGRERCVLLVHPTDAARAGLRDSQPALLESRVHSGVVPVRVTEDIMPGVVSLPHGWGHAASAPWQSTAGSHAGVSANDFTDDARVEGVVGQSILNGVPVRLRPVGHTPPATPTA